MRLASESKPQLAIPTYEVPSTSATSIGFSTPSTATRAAASGSVGIPSTLARSFPRPPGSTASGVSLRQRTPAMVPTSPSPPSAPTDSPRSRAAAASVRACSALDVSITWKSARIRSSSALIRGSAARALPGSAVGLTITASRRAIAGESKDLPAGSGGEVRAAAAFSCREQATGGEMQQPKRIWWARPRKLCALERPGGGGRSHRPERRAAEIAYLKERGVWLVVSTMTSRHNLDDYEAAGLEWRHVPGASCVAGAEALAHRLPLLR